MHPFVSNFVCSLKTVNNYIKKEEELSFTWNILYKLFTFKYNLKIYRNITRYTEDIAVKKAAEYYKGYKKVFPASGKLLIWLNCFYFYSKPSIICCKYIYL